jgi:DNA-binding transcriptional MerR regulator
VSAVARPGSERAAAPSKAPRPGGVDRGLFPYRMKDLCDQTGLSRQVIHFYIEQGLVPEGQKSGRNMAWYAESHIERIRLIRQLQHERFLPLRAIRAVLEEENDELSAEQRRLLVDVKHRLGRLGSTAGDEASPLVPLPPILARTKVSREDAEGLAQIGVISIATRRGRTHVAKDDVWMIELWAEMRAAGFSRALGFVPADVGMFAEEVEGTFAKETALLKKRLSHLSPEAVARMVEAAVPLINQFVARYHESLVRKFFASIQA